MAGRRHHGVSATIRGRGSQRRERHFHPPEISFEKRKNCSRNSAAVPAPAPHRLPKEHESQTKQPAPRTRPITTPWCQPEQHPVVACHHEFQDSSPGVRCNSFSRPSTSAGGILPSSLSAGPAHGPAGSSPFAGPAHGPAGFLTVRGSSAGSGRLLTVRGSSAWSDRLLTVRGSSAWSGRPPHRSRVQRMVRQAPYRSRVQRMVRQAPYRSRVQRMVRQAPYRSRVQRMVRQAPYRSQVQRMVRQAPYRSQVSAWSCRLLIVRRSSARSNRCGAG